MHRAWSALALAGLAGCAVAPTPGPGAEMAGRWRDEACQARPTQYPIRNIFVRRDFTFEAPGAAGGSRWGVDANFFSDAQCTQPVFTLHVRGRYELTNASAVAAGATEGTFRFDSRAVTAWSPAAVEAFQQARCAGDAPVRPGVQIDVSAAGCPPALSRPIRQSGQEYDLVGFGDGKLRFGVRTPEMGTPEGRPRQLSPFALARIP